MALTKDSVLASPDFVANYYKLISGTVTIAADGTTTLSIPSILGLESANYDLTMIEVKTFIVDPDSNSKTYNYWVDGSAVIAAGYKDTGVILLHNAFISSMTVRYRINLRLK